MKWSFRTSGNYIEFVHTDETDLHIESVVHRLHNTSRCIDWSLPEDTTRISFTIDETRYENVSIYDIDFDGDSMGVQGDFETGITAMFTGLAGGSSSSSLIYTATIAQLTGTGDDPTPVLFENTLGDTVVWTRFSAGIYHGTVTNGAFTSGKTLFPPFGATSQYIIMGIGSSLPFDYGYNVSYAGVNTIQVNVYKTSDYGSADLYTALVETPILIQVQVYP